MTRTIATLIALFGGIGFLVGHVRAAEDAKKENPLHPRVKMETTLGDIILELDAEKAPITVLNFIQYTEDKYYDGTVFHRVMKNFMIQGGGMTPDMEDKPGQRPGIRNEWKNGLKNRKGTIAMARLYGQADSATSQFFINVQDNPVLDRPRDGAGYAVFGEVVEGMETIEKIRNTPVSTHPKIASGYSREVPKEPVIIKSVRLVSAFDRAKVEAAAKAAIAAAEAEEKRVKAEEQKRLKEMIQTAEKESGTKAVTSSTGLISIVLKEGDGPSPEPTDKVEVHYTGWLLNGRKFDSSYDRGQPATFRLDRVIKGWTEGLSAMKVGGKRKLFIPPDLGYGKFGAAGGRIPPDATLVFDVELIGIKK